MKKIVINGLLAGLIMLIVSFIVGYLTNIIFPGLQAEYQTSGIFRPWSDPKMSIMFVHPFIVGVILAWIWEMSKSLFTDDNACARGCKFGFIYWIICLPGMVISYASFPLSIVMIISWSLSGAAQALSAGYFLASRSK